MLLRHFPQRFWKLHELPQPAQGTPPTGRDERNVFARQNGNLSLHAVFAALTLFRFVPETSHAGGAGSFPVRRDL